MAPRRQTGDVAVNGRRVGRRSKTSLLARPEGRLHEVRGGVGTIECFAFTEASIRPPQVGVGELAVPGLAALYKHGERYHDARTRLEQALACARAATEAFNAEGTPSQWRTGASAILLAANEVDLAVAKLEVIGGLQRIAAKARAASAALTRIVKEETLEAFADWCSVSAELRPSGVGPRRRGVASVAVAPEQLDDELEPEFDDCGDCDDASERAERSATAPLQERVHRDCLDARNPGARGALRFEDLVVRSGSELTSAAALFIAVGSAARAVAWRAWRAAGVDVLWSMAWDSWVALEQFALATIGAARGVTAKAVTHSRERCDF